MDTKKEFRSIPLWLVEKNEGRKEDYFFNLPFSNIMNANFEVPGLIKRGEKLAVVTTEGFIGVVPQSEYSISQRIRPSIVGRNRKGFLVDIVDVTFEDGDTEKLAIFSTKAYEQKIRGEKLERLKQAEYVEAKIFNIEDWGIHLHWEGIELEMNVKQLLNGAPAINPNLFLEVGDVIPVVYDRTKKNGRVIRVRSLYNIPKPAYDKDLTAGEIEIGRRYTGIVFKTTPTNVIVTIGRDRSGGTSYPVSISCFHPHESIDDLIFKNQVVEVKVTAQIAPSRFVGTIENVEPHYIDDTIFGFRSFIEIWNEQDESGRLEMLQNLKEKQEV